MKKYKCKKCEIIIDKTETYLDTIENRINKDPQNLDKQESFRQPILRHKVDEGEVYDVGFIAWWLHNIAEIIKHKK